MASLQLTASLLLQDTVSMATDLHWIMICEIVLTVIVVALLLGAIIGGLVVYSKINKLVKQVDAKAQPLLAQATPLIGKGKEIAAHVNDIVSDLKPKIAAVTSDLQPKIKAVTADLQPKIASVSSDVQRISSLVRSKVEEAGVTFAQVNQTVQGYNETAQDVNVKAKGQVERVNGMVSEALTTSQHVSKQIQHGIKVPIEKIASWVTAAKTGIEQLSDRFPFLGQTGPFRPAGSKPSAAGSRTGPGPVAVPQPAGRVVHSAEDEARIPGTPVRNTPSNN